MDRKTLINGIAAGGLLAVGIGAAAWAQRQPAKPTAVANAPMSLFDPADNALPESDSNSPSHAAAIGTSGEHETDSRSLTGWDRLTHGSQTLHPQLPSNAARPTESQTQQNILQTQLAAPRLPDQTNVSTADLNREGANAPLTLPTLPSTAPPQVEQTETANDSVFKLPSLSGTGSNQPNFELPALPVDVSGPGSVSGPDNVENELLTLPTLRIAEAETENAPPPVPADLSDVPIFELTPESNDDGRRDDPDRWDDTLIGDDGRIISQPPTLTPLPQPGGQIDPGLLLPEPIVETPSAEATPFAPEPQPSLAQSFMSAGFTDELLAPYTNRFSRFNEPGDDGDFAAGNHYALLPPSLNTWWSDSIPEQLRPSRQPLPVDLPTLVLRALEYSPDIAAFQLDPEIERKSIVEEQAAFDWTAFAETTYDDVSDPVGNTLTVGGGGTRLEDTNLVGSGGVRRKNEIGGEFEVTQRFGYQDSNSNFFLPTQQGTSRLTVSYTQPLLTGKGEAYQQSRTVLAMLETGATEDATADRIQDHLMSVAEAYWDLYRSRAFYIQRRNLLAEAERILGTLEGRSSMDTVPRQLLRARSAVLLRRSEMTRSAMEIRNAESRLRLLVGDPQMTSGLPFELLPLEAPVVAQLPICLADAARTAMAHRPDVRRAVKKVRSTGVRVGVAENELMPRLDLVFNGYLSGLEGEGRIFRSFGDQFSEGRPSFAAGLLFEIPIGNRAAKARHHRRQLQMVQATHELEATVETGLTEVEIAVRELETSYAEMANRFQSMQATGQEMDYLRDRWNLLPGGSSTTQLLEDLLDAQERLADDEAAFVTAQVNYVLATASLQRAMGTLLEVTSPNCPSSPLASAGPTPTVAESVSAESDTESSR